MKILFSGKKWLYLLFLTYAYFGYAQSTIITYVESAEAFANPERGFYHHEETHSTSYDALNQTTLTNYRINEKITLILRVFYLENFISSPISSAYLQNMQSDFNKIRQAGLKCVIRFAYSNQYNSNLPQEATKTQILAHIAQIKPILMAHADVIAAVQAGFIGTWGEWYYTTHFGSTPSSADYAARREVVEALLQALPPDRYVQIRTPKLKRGLFNESNPINATNAFQNTSLSRTGHHNDCFLASPTDEGTYGNLAIDYPYLAQETLYTPMGGETCAVNEPRSNCATALNELAQFHWSYINLDYHPGVISSWENNCLPEIEQQLGYRFILKNATLPQQVAQGDVLPITLTIYNAGFAAPFNRRTAYLVCRNTETNEEIRLPLQTDPRLWQSGETTVISSSLALPAAMPIGTYKLLLHLPDEYPALANRPEYAIRLANNGIWESQTGYNALNHNLLVTGSLTSITHESQVNQLVLFPVPANAMLTVTSNEIISFNKYIYNTVGQLINVDIISQKNNEVTFNTATLPNGMYFLVFTDGVTTVSKKFIVAH